VAGTAKGAVPHATSHHARSVLRLGLTPAAQVDSDARAWEGLREREEDEQGWRAAFDLPLAAALNASAPPRAPTPAAADLPPASLPQPLVQRASASGAAAADEAPPAAAFIEQTWVESRSRAASPISDASADDVAALLQGTVSKFLFGGNADGSSGSGGGRPATPPPLPTEEDEVESEEDTEDEDDDERIAALKQRIAAVRAELAAYC